MRSPESRGHSPSTLRRLGEADLLVRRHDRVCVTHKISDLVSMSGPQAARVLSVRFCHLRLPPRLPFNLFGFNILAVDADGDLVVDQARDQEILYALIVNQPVELQREVTIAFLNDLVGRQAVVADVAAERRDLADLPDLSASAADASAEMSSVDDAF
jgi:hypothetical protein